MKNQVAILSFDLGSITGWSRCHCSLQPEPKMVVVDHNTIYLDNLTNERIKREYNEIYSRSRVKLLVFEEVVRKLIESSKLPDAFVVEDVFCNPHRISAFRTLTLYLDTLERIVNTEYHKRLIPIPTKICKQVTTESGGAGKDDVQSAILVNKNIVVKRPEKLSEHSSDSIAVAWAFTQRHLQWG